MSEVEIKMSECGVLYEIDIAGSPHGLLEDKTFVVKDFFDVEGFVTGCGNPDWFARQRPAVVNADAVERLLSAGARLKGKACTDELASSLDGINIHYGTPLNSQLPARIPGGSSSGSASAVAAGYVDFGVGTDTVGSIRVPASYCGLFGMRPTHGVISTTGVSPLGETFDTVGWLSRDSATLAKVGRALLPSQLKAEKISKVCVARNLFDLIPAEIAECLLRAGNEILEQAGNSSTVTISDYMMNECVAVFGTIRSCEAWRNWGQWVENEHPHVSPLVLQRVTEGKTICREEEDLARRLKREIEAYFDDLIDRHGVILLPSTWEMPPLKDSSQEVLARNRANNIRLTALSPVAGLPQVSVPVEVAPGIKLGLSLMGARNSDLALLAFL